MSLLLLPTGSASSAVWEERHLGKGPWNASFWEFEQGEWASCLPGDAGLPYPPRHVCELCGRFCGSKRQVASESHTCLRAPEKTLGDQGKASETKQRPLADQ